MTLPVPRDGDVPKCPSPQGCGSAWRGSSFRTECAGATRSSPAATTLRKAKSVREICGKSDLYTTLFAGFSRVFLPIVVRNLAYDHAEVRSGLKLCMICRGATCTPSQSSKPFHMPPAGDLRELRVGPKNFSTKEQKRAQMRERMRGDPTPLSRNYNPSQAQKPAGDLRD